MMRRTHAGDESENAPTASPAQTQEVPQATIDALGRKCPIPIIMLAAQITQVPVRGLISVLVDDPAAYTDIPAWCRLKSHEHVASFDLPDGGWAIHVRRAY